MKLCAAQTRSFRGDIEKNIEHHISFVEQAVKEGADLVVFPELSVTGYEPALAYDFATDPSDPRFFILRQISNEKNIIIAIGAPIKTSSKPYIGMILFHPHKETQVYTKKYIHSSEEPYFSAGNNDQWLVNNTLIAPAICYEMSVAAHAANAAHYGAQIYLSSIVEDSDGVIRAHTRLSAIGKNHAMIVLMANCVGPTAVYEGGGRSAVWSANGELKVELDEISEGLLIYDTLNGHAIKRRFSSSDS